MGATVCRGGDKSRFGHPRCVSCHSTAGALRSVPWTGPGPKVRYKGKKGSIVVVKEEEEERYCFGS